jgi:hypothetical protein
MPLPSPTTLLDVMLQREGQKRRWTIRMASVGWACTVESSGHTANSACPTRDLALAKVGEWQCEIASAKADGWT